MPPHWQCKPMDKRFFVLTESIEKPLPVLLECAEPDC